EGHVRRITQVLDARVFHHFGVDAALVRSRPEHDIREHHLLVGLDFHLPREGNSTLHFLVVPGPFLVVEGPCSRHTLPNCWAMRASALSFFFGKGKCYASTFFM